MVMTRYNPYQGRGWTADAFKQTLMRLAGTPDVVSFKQWLDNWQERNGREWAEALTDFVLDAMPGGADLNYNQRQRIAQQIGMASFGMDVAAAGAGNLGGAQKPDIDRISEAFAQPFTTGGSTNLADLTGLGSDPFTVLSNLGARYAAAKASNNQDALDTLNAAAGYLGNVLGAYYGGNAGRNFARRLQRAGLNSHLWEDMDAAFSGIAGYRPIGLQNTTQQPVTQPQLPAGPAQPQLPEPSPNPAYSPNPVAGGQPGAQTPSTPVYSNAPAGGVGKGNHPVDFPLPLRHQQPFDPNRPIQPLAPGGPGASAASAWLIDTWRGVGGPSRLLPWAQAEVDQTRAAQPPGFFGDTGYQDAVDPETEEERRRRLAGVAW